LYGAVNHLFAAGIPYLAAWILVKRMKLYIGYTSTIKYAVGVLTVPLFYWLQSEWIQKWFSTEMSWWYLLSLPVAGLLAWEYFVLARKILKKTQLLFLKEKRILQFTRNGIINKIVAVRSVVQIPTK
jgi:hypothetical protein